MLDPSEGEIEEPSHVGRWRQPKEAVEPRAAVEEDRIYEYKPQRDVMPTAILELVLCKEEFPCIKDSQERTLPEGWRLEAKCGVR